MTFYFTARERQFCKVDFRLFLRYTYVNQKPCRTVTVYSLTLKACAARQAGPLEGCAPAPGSSFFCAAPAALTFTSKCNNTLSAPGTDNYPKNKEKSHVIAINYPAGIQ